MNAKELYQYAIDQATAVVVQVEPEQLDLATPVPSWTVRDLLQHMLHELAWAADILAGKTLAEVGLRYDGDLLGDDAITSWRRYLQRAQAALDVCNETEVTHLSYGATTVAAYLWEASTDQLVHAWDLGQGIGISVVFDEVVAEVLYRRERKKEVHRGHLGTLVSVPASANAQTRLLALLGRSEDWVETRSQMYGDIG